MSKVIVTGATGFIGSHLSRELALSNQVIALSSKHGDVCENQVWHQLKKDKISRVFHLAGKSFVPDSWTAPEGYYRTNLLGVVNALEFCRMLDAPMTYLSSYVYGTPDKLPISELSAVRANNPYAHTKVLAEQICDFYRQNWGLNITILRPFNVYGFGQSEKYLIPTIIEQALKMDEIRLKDLRPKRDYVYIDDLVRALVQTMQSEGGTYNIGFGRSWSVGEIVDCVQKKLRTNKPVISENLVRENEILDVVADTSAAQANLKWKAEVDLDEGIGRIIEGMRK